MRIAFVMVITAMVAASWSLEAQGAADREAAVLARRLVDYQLTDRAFRRQPCVSLRFGDCQGGVLIVRGYRLTAGARAPDTLRYVVEFDVVGTVGVSEAAPFFMPNAWVDSAEVLVVRRNGRQVAHSARRADQPVRTKAAVARRYFELDAEDRRLLDSAVAPPRRP